MGICVLMTSNLAFSKWEGIFKDAIMTAAAIDRLVHHRERRHLPEHEEHSSDKRPQYGDESLVINTRLDDLEREQNEEKKRDEDHKRRQLRFNRFTVIFTGVLVFATIAYDCVTGYIAYQAKLSADAAKSAANTAALSLNITQRAYVFPEAASWAADGKAVNVFIRNSGVSPAINATVQAQLTTFGGKYDVDSMVNEHNLPPPGSIGTIAAGSIVRTQNLFRGADGKTAIVGTKKGFVSAYIYGIITYGDIFGKLYHPRFCFTYNTRDGGFVTCGPVKFMQSP